MTAGRRGQAVVGVLANRGADGQLATQVVDEKYIAALHDVAGVAAVIIPAMGDTCYLDDILGEVDGLMLTGSVSNVHPGHFLQDVDESAHAPFDQSRDRAALHLIGRAIEHDIPLLAICRGFQELNVACGGTLRPDIFASDMHPGHHPIGKDLPLDVIYGPAHALRPAPASWIAGIGLTDPCVNSVHVQAVDRLGQGLRIDATAADGTIEAVSIPKSNFIVGVQWHPEFGASHDPMSAHLFRLFAEAVFRQRGRNLSTLTNRVEAAGSPLEGDQL